MSLPIDLYDQKDMYLSNAIISFLTQAHKKAVPRRRQVKEIDAIERLHLCAVTTLYVCIHSRDYYVLSCGTADTFMWIYWNSIKRYKCNRMLLDIELGFVCMSSFFLSNFSYFKNQSSCMPCVCMICFFLSLCGLGLSGILLSTSNPLHAGQFLRELGFILHDLKTTLDI